MSSYKYLNYMYLSIPQHTLCKDMRTHEKASGPQPEPVKQMREKNGFIQICAKLHSKKYDVLMYSFFLSFFLSILSEYNLKQ